MATKDKKTKKSEFPSPGGLGLDSVKRHLSRRHLSVLSVLFNFIFDGGRTREK